MSASTFLAFGTGIAVDAEAKTPGKTYCFHRTCHRVRTIAETAALIGSREIVQASHYDDCRRDPHNPCGLTSSGERFRADAPDNVASPIYPDGTTLLLWSPLNQSAAVVRVNNAGPYWGKRRLDVSRATAERLGFAGQGVAEIEVRVVSAPTEEEATYRANRKYRPVPGYIGRYTDTELAHAGAAAILAVDQIVVAEAASPDRATALAARSPEPAPAGEPTRVALAEINARQPERSEPPAKVTVAAAPEREDVAIEDRNRIGSESGRRSKAARYAMHAKKRIAARAQTAKASKDATRNKATKVASAGNKGRKNVSDGSTRVAALAPQAQAPTQNQGHAPARPQRDLSARAWSAPRGPVFFKFDADQAAAGAPLPRTSDLRSSSVANRS